MATAKRLKQGSPVRYTRKNGETVHGRVSGYTTLVNGEWALINLAEKGKPTKIAKVRPTQLIAV